MIIPPSSFTEHAKQYQQAVLDAVKKPSLEAQGKTGDFFEYVEGQRSTPGSLGNIELGAKTIQAYKDTFYRVGHDYDIPPQQMESEPIIMLKEAANRADYDLSRDIRERLHQGPEEKLPERLEQIVQIMEQHLSVPLDPSGTSSKFTLYGAEHGGTHTLRHTSEEVLNGYSKRLLELAKILPGQVKGEIYKLVDRVANLTNSSQLSRMLEESAPEALKLITK